MTPDPDLLSRFLLEDSDVRGELVQLSDTWQNVLARKDYPPAVRELLGEAMSAAALMSATIKFAGSFNLQIRGDGPVHLLVVQANADRTMRALARWRGAIPRGDGPRALCDLVGEARLAITIDPGSEMDRYQSIISLGGDTLADALSGYFASSEQLPTRFSLAVAPERCAGMLLQRLPGRRRTALHDEELDEQTWRHCVSVANTVREEELLHLEPETLLRRLFPDRPVRLFQGAEWRFRCTCSRAVIETTLRALGRGELAGILEEEGEIRVDCEFCNATYLFDAVDVEQVLAAEDVIPTAPTRH